MKAKITLFVVFTVLNNLALAMHIPSTTTMVKRQDDGVCAWCKAINLVSGDNSGNCCGFLDLGCYCQ